MNSIHMIKPTGQQLGNAKQHMREALEYLGIAMTTEHTKRTPYRIVNAYNDFFAVGREEPEWTDFPTDSSSMVIVKDITVYSLCAHHFLPFFGKASIGYIPNGKHVGLSKLVRVVNYFSHRPQVQEDLTDQVADYLVKKLQSESVIVSMSCEHLCMSMRGVESPGHTTITSAVRGGFSDNPMTRAEFYSLVAT